MSVLSAFFKPFLNFLFNGRTDNIAFKFLSETSFSTKSRTFYLHACLLNISWKQWNTLKKIKKCLSVASKKTQFLRVLNCLTIFFLANTHHCETCGKSYKHRTHLSRHRKYDCGKTANFFCPFCTYQCKRKDHFRLHVIRTHSEEHYRQLPDSSLYQSMQ